MSCAAFVIGMLRINIKMRFIWAATWETVPLDIWPAKSLISLDIYAVCSGSPLEFSLIAKHQRFFKLTVMSDSDYLDAQTDWNLHWAQLIWFDIVTHFWMLLMQNTVSTQKIETDRLSKQCRPWLNTAECSIWPVYMICSSSTNFF